MELIFLGTGTSTGIPQIGCSCRVCKSLNPKDKRLRSSVLVKINDIHFLIDIGPDFRQQILKTGLNYLSAILITHEHYDHIGGLDDIRPLGETTVYGENRVLAQIKNNMPYCFSEKRYSGVPEIHLHEVTENSKFYVQQIEITPLRVFHAKLPIIGYRINNLAYLTDVKTIPDSTIDKLQGLDVLVINALRIEKHIAHLSLSEALVIAGKIGAKKTYFTHFSHDLGLHEDVQKSLPENFFLAYDGLKLNL
ncbi:MAG: MBL fold metallo-hydrolase [Paludibacter sp.]|nr:MBL fold metallo-hydrolase [Paludibacter sp.]